MVGIEARDIPDVHIHPYPKPPVSRLSTNRRRVADESSRPVVGDSRVLYTQPPQASPRGAGPST